MNLENVFLASSLAVIIALTVVVLLPTGAAEERGEWVVVVDTEESNKTIVLNGNLSIENNATLTLNNVTLIVNSTSNGQYGIFSEHNTSIVVNNAKITAYNESNGFRFVLHGSAMFNHTEIVDVYGNIQRGGIQTDNQAIFKNSIIHDCQFYGIHGENTNLTLKNTTIEHITNPFKTAFSLVLIDSRAELTHSILANTSKGAYIKNSNVKITKSRICNTTISISQSSNVTISSSIFLDCNSFFRSGIAVNSEDAYLLLSDSRFFNSTVLFSGSAKDARAIIYNNTIQGASTGAIYPSENTAIKENLITDNKYGIYMQLGITHSI